MDLTIFFGLLGGLIVLAFVANRLFRHTRVPDLVVLIVVGILIGPVFHWINADQFRPVTQAFGTLALIVILFEGGLELKIRDTLRHFPGAFLLSALSFILTVGLTALVASVGLGLPLVSSLLIGAVVGCTSSSMVLPILQQMQASTAIKVTLLLEASLADVLAVLTAESLLNLHAGTDFHTVLRTLAGEFGIPLILAVAVGILWSRLLPLLSEQRFWHVLTFGVVLLLYACSNALHGNGLIAVLVFGLTLANFSGLMRPSIEGTEGLGDAPGQEHVPILNFHSELAFLLRTFFFALLGAVMELVPIQYILPTAGIVGAIFLARWLATVASRWSWHEVPKEERELIVWILPRGLITAVLAIQVVQARGSEFAFLPAVAFAVILVTNVIVIVGSVRFKKRSQASHQSVEESIPASPPANS
ncbi:MAG: cation:proton antiporter [bacterium]